MASVKIQMIIHYIESHQPLLRIAFVEQNKKLLTIIEHHKINLESYQVENGILKDEKVLAEKVLHISQKIEGKVKDGVHFVVDSPRVLNYSVILPKMNVKKASQMALKELEETFPKYDEYYVTRSDVSDAKEKGVFVYFELLPKDIIQSFMTISELMDKYIDSVNLGNITLCNFHHKCQGEQDDAIIVYGDEDLTMIGLALGQKLVESQTYYVALENDSDLFSKIGLGIKMMSGKHEFHYERRRAKNLLVITKDLEIKKSLETYLSEGYGLEPIITEPPLTCDLLEVLLLNDDYVDYVFKLDL